jgi:hypothetical protein
MLRNIIVVFAVVLDLDSGGLGRWGLLVKRQAKHAIPLPSREDLMIGV